MAEDSTLLPNVDEPPGQAPYYTAETSTSIPDAGGTVTGKGIAFDYSAHLNRLVTALDQISISMALIAENTQDLSDNVQNRIVPALETIAAKQTSMETYQKKLKELSEGAGIHTVGPYEWLSMYAIYKLLLEQGVTDFASLKAQVNSLPKEF
jgi:hypothetical protein